MAELRDGTVDPTKKVKTQSLEHFHCRLILPPPLPHSLGSFLIHSPPLIYFLTFTSAPRWSLEPPLYIEMLNYSSRLMRKVTHCEAVMGSTIKQSPELIRH